MPKYQVSWTVETWLKATIEAETEAEAVRLWQLGILSDTIESTVTESGYLQEGWDIQEIG